MSNKSNPIETVTSIVVILSLLGITGMLLYFGREIAIAKLAPIGIKEEDIKKYIEQAYTKTDSDISQVVKRPPVSEVIPKSPETKWYA